MGKSFTLCDPCVLSRFNCFFRMNCSLSFLNLPAGRSCLRGPGSGFRQRTLLRIWVLCRLLVAMWAAEEGRAAALDPKIGPNIRLGDDPDPLPATRRAQAEPHIVRSPSDPDVLVATFQEGRFEDGGAVDCGYAVSRDGGMSWSRRLIPHLSRLIDDGSFARASDPVAAIDLDGTVFLNTLGINGTPPAFLTTVLASKSTDGGRTFDAPIHIATAAGETSAPDKNWMAINTFAGTRSANRIAIAFSRPTPTNLANGPIQPIVLTFSDDHGGTWSPLQIISSPITQGAQPVFLADGSLAVAWWAFPKNPQADTRGWIELAYSADGGGTFSAPVVVAKPVVHDDPVVRDGWNLPSIATDRLAGILYIAYQGMGGSAPGVFFTRSTDRGGTWSTPVRVNDTPADRSVFNPALAVSPDGQHVSIVFYDKRNDPGAGDFADLYLAESFDGGGTWAPNTRVSEVSSDLRLAPLTDRGRMLGDYQGIAADIGFTTPSVACWIDTRTGSPDPFTARITRTRGADFETWRRLRFTGEELADSGVSGAEADPDGDGIPNFAEYALGREPRHADPQPLVVPGGVAAPGADVTLTYERLRTLGDAAFSWRASDDLKTWQPVGAKAGNIVPAAEPARERVLTTFANEGSGPRFFQLLIERKNPPVAGRGD
jgi:hypothetical protein